MDEPIVIPPRFKHQDEMFRKAITKETYAFFVEMGLGKTRVAIDLAMARRAKTLVIAPNTILENWRDEIKKWSGGKAKGTILQGCKEERTWLLKKTNTQFYIINYEALRIIRDELIGAGFTFVIADESTKLKGHKTLQSKNAFQIAQTIPFRLIMTGSPVMNNPLDLYGQFRFLNPYILGHSFYKFRGQYAIMGGYMNYQVRKWINMDRLKATMNQHCCIYFKKDCLDLPDKLYQIVRVDMSDEQLKLYKELKNSFVAEFKGHVIQAAVILTRMVRFSQITAGFTKSVEGEEVQFEKNPKIDWLEEFLSELPRDRKVIVFCRFIKEIHQVQALCNKLSIRYSAIWGETKDRQDQINMFNLQEDCRVFIGQIQTTGLGINLTAASYVVYLTNSYSYGDRIQSEDRAHRIGQDKNVTYIDVICRDSIDEIVYKALQGKKSIADYMLDKQPEELV